MQENEFEKQLKNMMEEFHLTPSDSVWEKVKQRLNKKDRRNNTFLFLLGIGLITGAFLIYHFTEQKQNLANAANVKTITQNNTDNNVVKDSTRLVTQKISAKKDEDNSSADHKINHVAYNKKLNNTESSLEKNAQHNVVVNWNYQKQKKDLAQPEPGNTNNFQQQYNTQITKNNKPLYKDSIFAKQAISNNDSGKTIVQKNIADSSNKNLTAINPTAASQKINTNYKTPNWQWGITAFYGRSNLVESLVNDNKSLAQYVNNNPAAGYDTAVHNAHPFSSAGAYSLGAVVKKQIFKNGFLSTGLNFTHLAAKSNVGETIDSAITIAGPALNYSVNRYVQPGSLKSYTSTYNFIELPFMFQQDFFHSKQTAFSYNAGVFCTAITIFQCTYL